MTGSKIINWVSYFENWKGRKNRNFKLKMLVILYRLSIFLPRQVVTLTLVYIGTLSLWLHHCTSGQLLSFHISSHFFFCVSFQDITLRGKFDHYCSNINSKEQFLKCSLDTHSVNYWTLFRGVFSLAIS